MGPISLPATTERVRLHTSASVNERIRLRTRRNVDRYRGRSAGEIADRITELDREWEQHALQGWCPPLSAIRRLGVRSAAEIEEERTALRAIRGDFTGSR
jgi:hypothetical protein